MHVFPKKLRINKDEVKVLSQKVSLLLKKNYKKFKKNEKNQNEFYKKHLIPDNKFNYYIQFEILRSLSIKHFILKSKIHDYIVKNISKDYLIYTMIFFRYHSSKKNISKKTIFQHYLHYDNYDGLDTNTFWIPLCNINKETGGLIFRGKEKDFKFQKKDFLRKKRISKKFSYYQTLGKVGECFVFNKKLFHSSNRPVNNNIRISLDIRIIRKKDLVSKKFKKNYYNSKGILRPNKFVSINKIDSEIKKYTKNNIVNLL